jgi:hypothetical protein
MPECRFSLRQGRWGLYFGFNGKIAEQLAKLKQYFLTDYGSIAGARSAFKIFM